MGIRDIDDFEAEIIDKHKIKHYTVEQTIDFVRQNPHIPFHVSFDVDALDPSYVSSTGTRVDNGMTPEEVRSIILETIRQESLVSLDVVEFNPLLGDPEHSIKAVQEVFQI